MANDGWMVGQISQRSLVPQPAPATPVDSGFTPTTGLVNGSARDTQAKITRDQYADYIKRFVPLEDELIDSYYNRRGITQDKVAESMDFTTRGFDNARRAQGITQSRYNAPMTQQEREAQERSFNMAEGLAVADNANRTRQHIADRYRNILNGGLTNISKQEIR